MRKYLIEINKFPADTYTADEAWRIFTNTHGYGYQIRRDANVQFVVNTEEDWHYIYRIGDI